MSSELDCHVPTYAVVDITKKKKHSAPKKDDQPEILSDVPVTYSKLMREKESSFPRNYASAAFDNETYSMVTLDNMCTDTTADESCQENPHDNTVGVKNIPCEKKLNRCDKKLTCISVIVIIPFLVFVGAFIFVFAEISLLKSKQLSIQQLSSDATANNKSSCEELNSTISFIYMQVSRNFSVLENCVDHLIQNHSQLNNETQNRLSGLEIVLNQTLSAIVNKTEIKLDQTLSAVLNESKILIQSYSGFHGTSCAAILWFNPSSPSGHYWIRSSNGSAIRVYCDMTSSCGNITGGWMRVAELDMSDNCSQCPSALRMVTACNPKRTCVINSDSSNCSSVFFTTHGLNYSRVYGMIRAYQVGTPDAFGNHGQPMRLRNFPDSNYVDGISLTHGAPRQHIWTFAAESCKIYLSSAELSWDKSFIVNHITDSLALVYSKSTKFDPTKIFC